MLRKVSLGSKNFALMKWANQSSTLEYAMFNWTADKAVDGNTNGTDADNSKTCSATRVGIGNHTWVVDIGFSIIVKNVSVYKRVNPGDDQLSGFKVFIGNTTTPWTETRELADTMPVGTRYSFIVNDLLAQFVSVVRINKTIMTICEVEVFGECQKGKFGDICNETCGNCINGNVSCNSTNGHCTEGCQQGWTAVTCKVECNAGYYGFNCNETCGQCLNGNNSCSKVKGQCEGGCQAGWKEETCKSECEAGSYGFKCNETCGNCLNGTNSCSKVNGECNGGCLAGWKEKTCKSECPAGSYGFNCIETCGNCLNGTNSCSRVNGECIGGCQSGWKEETCKSEIRVEPPSSANAIIIGVVVPVVILFIIVIIVLVILGVRRGQRNFNKDATAMPKQKHNVFQHVVPKSESSETNAQEIEDRVYQNTERKTTLMAQGVPDRAFQNTEGKTPLMAQGVPVQSFWSYVMKKKANKGEFESEFKKFRQGLTKTHNDAKANPSKNRYKSIYPYDFNRVILKRDTIHDSEYENDSDYINASKIQGFDGRKCYIAAQGPINQTVGDFWWLVWQEQTECIVMLTNLNEMGKMKCIQYWPDMEEQTHGDVTVKIQQSESFAEFIRRDFQISVRDKTRKVTQFHYIAWPDKDIPDTAWSLVEFWKSVRKHNSYDNGPVVVHCSAGVGRTGTFIALDIIYDETRETGHVDVKRCVENLREQRVNMVQTANQFIYLHDVVAETFGFGTMPVFRKQFASLLRHLMEDEGAGLPRLDKQYFMLVQLNLEQAVNDQQVYSNANVFQTDFVWLPNLSGRDAYIAVKGVKDERLLSIIREKNVNCLIIMDSSSHTDFLFSVGVNQSKTVASVNITCIKREELVAFERNQFSIAWDEREEPRNLTMFLLKTWEESKDVPSDSESVLSLLEDVSRLHPSPNELNPVLLYSRVELTRTILFYILLNEQDRICRDGEIHILRTSVEMLGRSGPFHLLPMFEQYVFIYKCFATDALQESTYANTAGVKRDNA